MSPGAASALPPLRRYVHPEPGDDWVLLARRCLAGESESDAIARLKAWNPTLVSRPPTISLTPLDIVFVEPRAGA